MASRLLAAGQKELVFYTRSLQALRCQLRAFCSQRQDDASKATIAAEKVHHRLDLKTGIFGPLDKRAPFPGNVGPSQALEESSLSKIQSISSTPEVLSCSTSYGHQLEVLKQVQQQEELLASLSDFEQEGSDITDEISNLLECRAQYCPDLMKKDFQDLFPTTSLKNGPLTVITLCQRTVNDMSGWSEKVEMERSQLIDVFVDAAGKICEVLKNEGYWADFIDPCSGRPFIGSYTHATMFETDERYRKLGFIIEDVGCCKVITHRRWGTNIFVGSVFTNAPLESEVLDATLRRFHSQ